MNFKSLQVAVFGALVLSFGAAQACTIVSDTDGTLIEDVQALSAGIFKGALRCGDQHRDIGVWTMDVDPTVQSLGIRDEPMFTSLALNPLRQIASVGYDQTARFTIFRRAEATENTTEPHRLFATLCTDGESPLNCSVGGRRVKIRVDLLDQNQDGQIDHAHHQISIYDGDARMQVIFIDLPHDPRPHVIVAQWIDTFSSTGALDLDKIL